MANADETPLTCTECGKNAVHKTPWRDDLCNACDQARVEEIHRIAEHYERHPDECCCHTYLGRHCCESPIHGGWWRVNGIENGERFYFLIRAKSRAEAMAVGTEACLDNGEECIGVTQAKNKDT
jgi:hypothetical protein